VGVPSTDRFHLRITLINFETDQKQAVLSFLFWKLITYDNVNLKERFAGLHSRPVSLVVMPLNSASSSRTKSLLTS